MVLYLVGHNFFTVQQIDLIHFFPQKKTLSYWTGHWPKNNMDKNRFYTIADSIEKPVFYVTKIWIGTSIDWVKIEYQEVNKQNHKHLIIITRLWLLLFLKICQNSSIGQAVLLSLSFLFFSLALVSQWGPGAQTFFSSYMLVWTRLLW